MFGGRPLDADMNLYCNRARWYSPELGRFISRDPISVEGSQWNVYAYAQNSPIAYRDPSGLTCFCNVRKRGGDRSRTSPWRRYDQTSDHEEFWGLGGILFPVLTLPGEHWVTNNLYYKLHGEATARESIWNLDPNGAAIGNVWWVEAKARVQLGEVSRHRGWGRGSPFNGGGTRTWTTTAFSKREHTSTGVALCENVGGLTRETCNCRIRLDSESGEAIVESTEQIWEVTGELTVTVQGVPVGASGVYGKGRSVDIKLDTSVGHYETSDTTGWIKPSYWAEFGWSNSTTQGGGLGVGTASGSGQSTQTSSGRNIVYNRNDIQCDFWCEKKCTP